MLNQSLKFLTLGAALALAATGAWAQAASTKAAAPETKVGVTPQDAKEAAQKAAPAADTATLVRTGPSAADGASDLTKDAKEAVKPNETAPANAPKPMKNGATTNQTGASTAPVAPSAPAAKP